MSPRARGGRSHAGQTRQHHRPRDARAARGARFADGWGRSVQRAVQLPRRRDCGQLAVSRSQLGLNIQRSRGALFDPALLLLLAGMMVLIPPPLFPSTCGSAGYCDQETNHSGARPPRVGRLLIPCSSAQSLPVKQTNQAKIEYEPPKPCTQEPWSYLATSSSFASRPPSPHLSLTVALLYGCFSFFDDSCFECVLTG